MHKIIPIIHVLSKLGVLFSVLLLVPTFVSYLFLDDALPAFGRTALVTIIGSVSVWLLTWHYNRELRQRDGFTLVFMLWVGFAAIAAMPFYLYFPNMSYTDAFFEAMSGLTTTGATVISSLDTLAPSLNFWRHMMNWLGGMGIIVLAVAILPMLGVGGTQLFKAEIPGIDKDSKMAPRISQTAKQLWMVYLLFTVLTCIALKISGMSWFDAICHSMSTFSLGGFSIVYLATDPEGRQVAIKEYLPNSLALRAEGESHPIEATGRELRGLMAWVKSHDDDYVEGTAAR